MAFSWNCPFCNRTASITQQSQSVFNNRFDDGNKYGEQLVRIVATTCPNRDCAEFSLVVQLHKPSPNGAGIGELIQKWPIRPSSTAKVFPSYVPKVITEDYTEACLIRDLSPKASATLSRRCLQGMIRDYWKISRGRLVDEIEALAEKVDATTWAAIDAVRKVGNIGAHMEKDIGIVIEVDPGEAQILIGLIETLLKEWYVARHEREAQMASLVALAQAKTVAKTKDANG